jgi:hypothetical protein
MSSPALSLHPDRLLPAEPGMRAIARRLYAQVAALPIVSPHGHTDPAWFAEDAAFANATELLLVPDHYVFRMLYSQGVDLDALGIPAEACMAIGDNDNDREMLELCGFPASVRSARPQIRALARYEDDTVEQLFRRILAGEIG